MPSMNIDRKGFCRRQAVQLAAQLPDDKEEAEFVISLLRQILREFLAEAQAPSRLTVLEGGNSPNLRASSSDSPSVRPKKT